MGLGWCGGGGLMVLWNAVVVFPVVFGSVRGWYNIAFCEFVAFAGFCFEWGFGFLVCRIFKLFCRGWFSGLVWVCIVVFRMWCFMCVKCLGVGDFRV